MCILFDPVVQTVETNHKKKVHFHVINEHTSGTLIPIFNSAMNNLTNAFHKLCLSTMESFTFTNAAEISKSNPLDKKKSKIISKILLPSVWKPSFISWLHGELWLCPFSKLLSPSGAFILEIQPYLWPPGEILLSSGGFDLKILPWLSPPSKLLLLFRGFYFENSDLSVPPTHFQ